MYRDTFTMYIDTFDMYEGLFAMSRDNLSIISFMAYSIYTQIYIIYIYIYHCGDIFIEASAVIMLQ
jgi:hypothetical protein